MWVNIQAPIKQLSWLGKAWSYNTEWSYMEFRVQTWRCWTPPCLRINAVDKNNSIMSGVSSVYSKNMAADPAAAVTILNRAAEITSTYKPHGDVEHLNLWNVRFFFFLW